jgi:glycosyltransferase involved in cell wall biosynthesis
VLSVPGRHSATQFVPLFCHGLEEAGAEIVDVKDWRIWLFGFDVINLHFPAHYIAEKGMLYSLVRSALSLIFYCLAKTVGRCAIVYTVHDIAPFQPRREWLLWPYLGMVQRLTDGYIFLSDSSQSAFMARYPDQRHKPWVRVDHGAFPVDPADEAGRSALREALVPKDSRDLLVGFLGSIKPYKGIETLALLPPALADGTPVRVVVAGSMHPSYRPVAEPVLAQIGERLIRIDRNLSDAELEALIQSVDLVLLPYREGWNSGMAMLVLSTHSRVLASRRPLFMEIEAKFGAPWVYTFEIEPSSPEAGMQAVLARIRRDKVQPTDLARLRDLLAERRFMRGGETLIEFYRALRGRRAQ